MQSTLEDFQLSRKERGEIRDLLDKVKGDEQKRALYRSMAFDAAREVLGKADAGQRYQTLDWLEDAVKAWNAIVSDNPGSQIILSGDSAGGGLSLALMMRLQLHLLHQ